MRHVITVVGSRHQLADELPRIRRGEGERLHVTTWYACANQQNPDILLDDTPNIAIRLLKGLSLGYRFYQFVQGTKLWSGRRPLILVHGRSMASRIAAYAGTWGGGDVVMPIIEGEALLKPTRFVLDEGGNLVIHAD